MTRIFTPDGVNIPVTVIETPPCTVTQIKTTKKDGYNAVQLGGFDKLERKVNKPEKGHFAKAGATPKKYLRECRLNSEPQVAVGDQITLEIFKDGDLVNVLGCTKGKGFAGHMKRHNFSGGRRSHGKNSVMRAGGSVGSSASPSRIWPGTKMPGRMGNDNLTVRNLMVVRIDKDNNHLYIRGAVPGAKNEIVYVTKK